MTLFEKIENKIPITPQELWDIVCDCYPELIKLQEQLVDFHKGIEYWLYVFNYKGKVYGFIYERSNYGFESESSQIVRQMKPVITYDYEFIE